MASINDTKSRIQPQLFLCLHCGAGNFARDKHKQYKQIMKNACTAANTAFQKTKCVRTAVVTATEYLENSPLINAGLNGSNLTIKGTIECDAGLLNINTQKWSAITSVSNIPNPIRACEALYLHSQTPLSNGRIPPIFLCGESASNWCAQHNIPTNNDYKISDIQQSIFDDYSKHISNSDSNGKKRKLSETHSSNGYTTPPSKKRKLNGNATVDSHGTCGVIGFDLASRQMFVSSSSGGIWMKHCGRIGPSAVVGTGFDGKVSDNISVGCCASGSGEYLMGYRLSQRCCDALIDCSNDSVLDENILTNVFDGFRQYSNGNGCGNVQRNGGCLVMKVVEDSGMEISINWIHNSQSMGIAVFCEGNIERYEMSQNDGSLRNKSVVSGYQWNGKGRTASVQKTVHKKIIEKVEKVPVRIESTDGPGNITKLAEDILSMGTKETVGDGNVETVRENTEKVVENVVSVVEQKENTRNAMGKIGENVSTETTKDKSENVVSESKKTFMNGLEILTRDYSKGMEIEYDSDPENKNNDGKSHIHKAKLLKITKINIDSSVVMDGEMKMEMSKMVVKDESGSYDNLFLNAIHIKLDGKPTLKDLKKGCDTMDVCDSNKYEKYGNVTKNEWGQKWNGMNDNHNHNYNHSCDVVPLDTGEDTEMFDSERYLREYEFDETVLDQYPKDLPSYKIDSPINQVD